MSASRITRTITRIAYQIFEDTGGSRELVICGIDERGYHLASMLASRLTDIYQAPVKAHALMIKKATSDLSDNDAAGSTELPRVQKKKVIIVDDVMYSGRTMYQALQIVAGQGDPEEINLAALIDRGHRKFPVSLQYLGLFCPTKLKEHVHCRFQKDGSPEGVWLER